MASREEEMPAIRLDTPLSEEDVLRLRAGQQVLISGVLYTARDAAHRRMADTMERGDELPFDVSGQVIYYVGPTPAPPGRVIGACGPTTARPCATCCRGCSSAPACRSPWGWWRRS